jgi:hypothetical protein
VSPVAARATRLLLVYAVAGIVTLALLHGVAGARAGWRMAMFTLVAVALLPLALARWSRATVLRVAFLMLGVGALAAWLAGAIPVFPYGDGEMMARYLEEGERFPRWLLGMAIAVPVYQQVWQGAVTTGAAGSPAASAMSFASLACLLTMAAGTQILLRQFPGRLAVALPLFVPLWVLFSVGYVEYYPLVMPVWIGTLAWAFERPLHERPAWAIGAVAGMLPAVYVGMAGLAVALVVAGMFAHGRRSVVVAATALATGVAVVWVAYPAGLWAFPADLGGQLNLGDTNTLFGRYIGQSAGPRSVFFTASYALSPVHLGDVLYMTVWGGGWLFLPLAVAALTRLGAARIALAVKEPRAWLVAGLLAWQAYYLLFMIPKLGPTADIDLFAPTFTLWAFVAGLLVDQAAPDDEWRNAAVVAAAGVCAATTPYLLTFTLPVRT